MSALTSEQLAQRAHECRLLEIRELNKALSAVGDRSQPHEFLAKYLVQNELLTNWQIQRLVEGHRRGYFYGSWKVLYLVGAGTFARVYRGAHIQTGDVKAIKVLRNRYSSDPETQDRFLKEARMVMKLRHPNIVPIYEVEIDRGRTYMVMDFIEGQNLRDFVLTHKQLKLETALKIARDLAAGLDYAFNLGICHRDIKLSNVLLSTKGQAKLVDFGLAAMASDSDKADEFTPRSIDYAGLEKTTGVKRDDKRSDTFFLGCVLYQMISGKPPLAETRERIKRLSPQRFKGVEPITNLVQGLPHRVVVLVHRLMELDPEKRSQTPGLALREIDSVISAINTGDNDSYDAELAKRHADEYAKRVQKVSEGDGKTIMVIESHKKIQDALRQNLKNLGYRPIIISDPQRAVQRFDELDPAEEVPAHCIIFGGAGLGRSAIEAFNVFTEHDGTKGIPMILLVPEQLKQYLSDAKLTQRRIMLDLPLEFKQVRRALREILRIAEGSPDA